MQSWEESDGDSGVKRWAGGEETRVAEEEDGTLVSHLWQQQQQPRLRQDGLAQKGGQ